MSTWKLSPKTLLFAGFFLIATAAAESIPVELRETESGWELLRGGEPYLIKGAGGTYSLEQLAASGANSVRTWDAEGIDQLLDDAHTLGLSVAVGIWLGHERHGFDYSDEKQVAAQKERARQFVQRYKDHPAVLLWGIGNEMEGYEDADNPLVWEAVNDIAVMIKQLDPNHPTMTVTAELGGQRIEYVHQRCPAIDIHGINSYGGALSVAERLRAAGGDKPYILTEFGPPGTWEVPGTDWGAPYEMTSTEKAGFYEKAYRAAVIDNPGQALGSYAFNWGFKMEGTSTWFGMFLEDGARLAAVDTMTELWSGAPVENLAPLVEPLVIEESPVTDPGQVIEVRTRISDPEGSAVRARWVLRPESGDYVTGGDFRQNMPDIAGVVLEGRIDGARIQMPEEPGAYRLFLYAYDGDGNAATANLPLDVREQAPPRVPMFTVYEDAVKRMTWVPSGWMGEVKSLQLDGNNRDNPQAGKASIRLSYAADSGWAGIAWQNPPNNWGDKKGGIDLTGAVALELWARGEYGGEKISVGVGLIGDDKRYPDSAIVKSEGIVLTSEWQRFEVPLQGADLSSIKTGFVVVIEGQGRPVTVYLDSIRYVR